jgi:hypothetical protein
MKKEILTKDIIEHDIKKLYIWKLRNLIPAMLFSYLGALFLWFYCDLNNKNNRTIGMVTILTVYIIFLIFITIYLIYLLWQYLRKNAKYTIVSDTFIGIGTKHRLDYGLFGRHCLCFSNYGKFALDFHKTYYNWSELYATDNDGIIKRSIPGDSFYLIIENEKIINVYNKKTFIFNDK